MKQRRRGICVWNEFHGLFVNPNGNDGSEGQHLEAEWEPWVPCTLVSELVSVFTFALM